MGGAGDLRPGETNSAYRPELDGLRALAVLAVIAFHARLPGFSGGFVGVDVFFVLSGYLISGIIIRALEKGTFTFADFYSRRINRIFPALIVVLLGAFALGWYLLFRSEFVNLGKHIAAGATFLSNAALVQETGYFDIAAEKKPLLHLWSLAIEEQFYLLWPLLLAISWRYRTRFALPALALGTGSFFLAILSAYTENSATGFYLPFTRLWELVAGFALFYSELIRSTDERGSFADAKGWIGLVLICVTFVFVDTGTGWPSLWTLLPVVGTVLIISAGSGSWLNRMVLASPGMVFIGLISYPLYLWHWPLFAFARFVEPRDPALLICAAIILSFALAVATYKLVEFPIRFRPGNRGRRAILLVVALAGTGLLGAFAGRKIPIRLDSLQIQSIQEALVDWRYPDGGFDVFGNLRENIVAGNLGETVLFGGDSHMEQYWPRIDSLIHASPATMPTAIFATARACPTLPGVGRKDVTGCEKLYSTVMKRAQSPGIRAVVLTSYWDDFFRRSLIYRADDPAKSSIAFQDGVTDSIFTSFERDIASLVRAGKKVFVVLTIPIGDKSEFDPRLWLPHRLDPASGTVVPKIDRADFVTRMEPVQKRVRDAAVRAGAVILDPVPFLCDAISCPTIDGTGRPLYMDARHLRWSVARRRAVWMDATLK